MATPPYRNAESCASCHAQVVAADAYLSSRGPVCEACHKAEATADRQREVGRESNTNALLGGIFSTLGGVALLAVGVLADEIPVRICLIAAGAIVTAVLRVPRMHTNAAHGTAGKSLVFVGAVLGALGVLALGVRLAG